MEMLPDGSLGEPSSSSCWSAKLGGSVALARLRTNDSAPPMPRSRWMNTTCGLAIVWITTARREAAGGRSKQQK
jgi:hypothetical protein